MRNWNLIRVCTLSLVRLGLPDYLWGIETDCGDGVFHPDSASRLPMRNWNCTMKMSGCLINCTLPDYLWGIETVKNLQIFPFSRASRLPMRNWNFSSRWTNQRERGFQTTYEELKPRLRPVGSSENLRFQTTYEELKRLSLYLRVRIFASRLPMRNWNRFGSAEELSAGARFQTTYEELKR